MSSKEDDLVNSLGDFTVFKSDLATLSPGQWLNDNIVNFAIYQSIVALKDTVSAFLLPPAIVHLSLQLGGDKSLLPWNDIVQHQWLIVPVNNSDQVGSVGGSHWSLLVYSFKLQTFFYMDSANCMNKSRAERIKQVLVVDLPSRDLVVLDCLQQINGNDCGVYTIHMAQSVLEIISNENHYGGVNEFKYMCERSFGLNGKGFKALEFRQQLLRLLLVTAHPK